MAKDDLVYLLRRAAEERKMASEAVNGEARAAHIGLADAYEEKVRGVGSTAAPAASEHLND